MLPEQLNEKLTTEIKQVELPLVKEYDFFVKYKDFEKLVWFITLFSLIIFVVAIIL